MPLSPPPSDNALLPAWVRDELYPWTQQVETYALGLADRAGALETWTQKATSRLLALRAKLLSVVARIRGQESVRGKGAPSIYDELRLFRDAFSDLDVPDSEWS